MGRMANVNESSNNNNSKVFRKKSDSLNKTMFDQKRKMMHKEIERRRRDKINDWIVALSKEVPDCALDNSKQSQSKGVILAKTVQYIQQLRDENILLKERLSSIEAQTDEIEELKRTILKLEKENNRLASKEA